MRAVVIPIDVMFKDLNRYASRILKVSYEGPDVQEEQLYRLMRVRGTEPLAELLI